MPKDNYTVAKICYFITSAFAAYAAFANFRAGRTVLAVVWAVLCIVFLFASSRMKAAGKKAKEIGMVDNSKSARKAEKQRKAAERSAAAKAATSKIVDPAEGDGNIASAVSASLYFGSAGKGKKSEEAHAASAEEPAQEDAPSEDAGKE